MKNRRPTPFRRYPFEVGEWITIEDGPRRGDWEVTALTESKVTLRCPVSGTVVTWSRFCYQLEGKGQKTRKGSGGTEIPQT